MKGIDSTSTQVFSLIRLIRPVFRSFTLNLILVFLHLLAWSLRIQPSQPHQADPKNMVKSTNNQNTCVYVQSIYCYVTVDLMAFTSLFTVFTDNINDTLLPNLDIWTF